jgi:hypothetical protein
MRSFDSFNAICEVKNMKNFVSWAIMTSYRKNNI